LDAHRAFEQCWFGAKSLPRVQELVPDLRVRYDAYPSALRVLAGWRNMVAETRRNICHWHLQLADPLYRRFTGVFLVERLQHGRGDITRDLTTRWVQTETEERWGALQLPEICQQTSLGSVLGGNTDDQSRPTTSPVSVGR